MSGRLRFRTVRYALGTDKWETGRVLRVALLSDLHGKDDSGLCDALKKEAPDMIALVGDLLERPLEEGEVNPYAETERAHMNRFSLLVHRTLRRMEGEKKRIPRDSTHIYALMASLTHIAPCFYVLGNHERQLSSEEIAMVKETGVRLLVDEYSRFDAAVGSILVGGTAPCPDSALVERLAEEEGVKVLLCHCPEFYGDIPAMERMDMVLSGHAHGGQIRLFGRGLFAPGQGFLPKYAGGVYHKRLVVGRGLANTTFVPRLFNPREIAIVTLSGTAAKEKNTDK